MAITPPNFFFRLRRRGAGESTGVVIVVRTRFDDVMIDIPARLVPRFIQAGAYPLQRVGCAEKPSGPRAKC